MTTTEPHQVKDQSLVTSLDDDTTSRPPWDQPEGEQFVPLQLHNSLTNSQVPFITASAVDGAPNTLTWYTCGPTVYSHAHLGHARTYLSFDILRRILRDYFRYDIHLVMNITDVDDKIIIASNEQNVPFTDISRRFENEFFEDLDALGIERPDTVTRVSEYVPEIVAYIEQIIANGFAYESNNSVYFDTHAFAEVHNYPKLVPGAWGNSELLAEGEGKLGTTADDKKHASDFALWKASKEGEPFWTSPWGNGRPGWHIECSVMASAILGKTIDIHSGGVDLTFPHHDNELAQAEAYYGHQQWINYFLHSGHLHIHGRKMSKSLKNFITIREVLDTYTARQIRILFLQHRYGAQMQYSTDSLNTAQAVEKAFVDFFANVSVEMRRYAQSSKGTQGGPEKWGSHEHTLQAKFAQAKADVHAALLDNIDTPTAMLALQQLIKDVNLYLRDVEEAAHPVRAQLLASIAKYIARLFDVFGLNGRDLMGFAAAEGDADSSAMEPVLDVFSSFRTQVRNLALAAESSSLTQQLLQLCDDVRDNQLPPTGVIFEDRDGATQWKIMDKKAIQEQLAAEQAQAQEAERIKAERKAAADAAQAEKDAKAAIPPDQLFRDDPEFSAFDDSGFPTHDADGNELTKSRLKKLTKLLKAHQKAHDKWLKKQST